MNERSSRVSYRIMFFVLIAFLFNSLIFIGNAEARRIGRKWAVVVGINEYMKEVTPLRCAVKDAEAFRKVLIEKAGFAEGDVYLLTSNLKGNRLPDKSNIIRWISYIKSNVSSEDTFIFFFSGHGMDMAKESYLLTYEADPYSKDTLDVSSLKVSDLRKIIEEVPVGRILIFVDACRNDPRTGKGEADNVMSDSQSKNLVIKSGYSPSERTGGNFSITFFSCKVGQRSYEWTEQGMGYFTYYLVKGISGDRPALDGNGNVTLGTLMKYVGREVPMAVKREKGESISQNPFYFGDASADAEEWVISRIGGSLVAYVEPTTVREGSSSKDRAEMRYLEGDDHYYKMKGYIDLGYIDIAKEELKKSYEAYTEAIQLKSDYSEAYASRGVLFSEAGEFDMALKDCNKAIELDPQSAQAYNNRAAVYYRKEEYDKAIADCTKAIELDSELVTAYNVRGYAYSQKGDLEKALADFSIVIKLDSKRATAYDYRGRVYSKMGQTDKAIEDFTKAVTFRPRYYPAYFDRAVALFSKGQYEKSLADCNKVIELNPNFAPAYEAKARACEKLGRTEEAFRAIQKFQQLTPPEGLKKPQTKSTEKSTNNNEAQGVDTRDANSKLRELEEKLKRLEGK